MIQEEEDDGNVTVAYRCLVPLSGLDGIAVVS